MTHNNGPAGFEQVVHERELREGRLLAVELSNNVRLCLVRTDGEVYAISDLCTHAEYQLSDGSFEGDGVIECGLHGARFDVRDGRVLEGPAQGKLPVYEVQIIDGIIWVGPQKG